MKIDDCQLTAQVIQANRDGNWSGALKNHAAACEPCAMARWMGEMSAAIESRAGAPPEPELIWLKARIRARAQPPKPALLPIGIAQWFGTAGFAALFAGFSERIWEWPFRAFPLAPGLSETLAIWLSQPQAILWLLPAGILLLLALGLTASEV
ncbi:MAG: hypothetical protein OXF43_09365 [Gammaproteobacteria bacterium]|nr:hypothetical protein [Gammaproteobacteria bacterium]